MNKYEIVNNFELKFSHSPTILSSKTITITYCFILIIGKQTLNSLKSVYFCCYLYINYILYIHINNNNVLI